MTDPCRDVREASAELALGILPADEHGPVIAHLDTCQDCQAYLRRSVAVGDQLLTLFPANEPPMGFEERVATRIGLHQPTPDRPRARRRPARRSGTRRWRGPRLRTALLAAGVAVVFGAAGVLGGYAVGPHQPSTPGPSGTVTPADALVDAPLVAGSRQVGRFYAYTGSPAWIYLGVDLAGWNGSVDCQLVRRDGSVRSIGWFPVTGGHAYWGAPSPLPPDAVAGVRLVGADGTVLAAAALGH